MTILSSIANSVALLAALAVSPFLLVRLCRPSADRLTAAALTGVAAVGLNLLVPLGLHAADAPITAASLTAVHLLLAAMLILLARWRGGLTLPPPCAGDRAYLVLFILFALLVPPLTHLAGIDTYKWQGLATNVAVERNIPWLVHPISLLGFSPRAYPSAQPLLLATVQILGRTGVDAGYYLVSLLSGATGLLCAGLLGRRVFERPGQAAAFAAFYVLSPVFMRYNHWATGRGVFLALYPIFVLCLVHLPRAAAWPGALAAWLLLALAHKAGLFAGLLLPVALLSPLVPRRGGRVTLTLLALPCVAAAILLSPAFALPGAAGRLAGCVRAALTRFGWMLPAAAVGLIAAPTWLRSPSRRRLLLPLLATLPLAFLPDMYGAMLTLPFVTLAATDAGIALTHRFPAAARRITALALLLSLCGALVIVLHRNANATPPRIYRAARFLESHDPRGPFRVDAPGRARVQIHAYVSGCPRFELTPDAGRRVAWRRPPVFRRPLQAWMRDWIDFGRNLMEIPDIAVDWYGINPRRYYIVIDGEGVRPDDGVILYEADEIVILAPRDQVAAKAQRERP